MTAVIPSTPRTKTVPGFNTGHEDYAALCPASDGTRQRQPCAAPNQPVSLPPSR